VSALQSLDGSLGARAKELACHLSGRNVGAESGELALEVRHIIAVRTD
jgi:hypothetical protein